MQRTLYSRHLYIVGIILRSQRTSPSRTDLSIAVSSNIRYFLQEICIHFTQDNVLQSRLSFLQFLLFYFFSQFNDLFSSMEMQELQICRNFQSVFISVIDVFSGCKDAQSAMGQGQKYGYNHGDFCCTQTTTSPLQ